MKSKTIKLKLIAIFALVFLLNFISGAQSVQDLLTTAWNEYSFKEINKASKLFAKAEELAKTNKEKCEALAGIAFCLQFGKRNNVTISDLKQVVTLYDEAIKKLDKNDKLYPFFLAMKAEALMQISKNSTNRDDISKHEEEAWKIWKILDSDYSTDVFRQDSLLTRAALASNNYKSEDSIKAHNELKNYVLSIDKKSSSEEKILVPVMCSQIAEHSFINNDFKTTVEFYKLYALLGPTSFPMKAYAYFKIARIAELLIKDNNTAIEYYRRFYNECNSNEKSYFAKKKAEELSGQKIE